MPTIGNPPFERSAEQSVSRRESALTMVLRVVRWTLYGCALIVLILLLQKPTPPSVMASAEAAARVEQKFQDAQQAVDQGQAATLTMNETELNSYLASHLDLPDDQSAGIDQNSSENAPNKDQASGNAAQTGSAVRDVKVQLLNDRVKAYVVLDLHGKKMTLQLEGKLGEDNGFLTFEPVSGQIGALPIPQSTLEAMARHILDSPENRDKLRLSDDIADLKIENGEVVAEYQ
jgi:hypothetical protein